MRGWRWWAAEVQKALAALMPRPHSAPPGATDGAGASAGPRGGEDKGPAGGDGTGVPAERIAALSGGRCAAPRTPSLDSSRSIADSIQTAMPGAAKWLRMGRWTAVSAPHTSLTGGKKTHAFSQEMNMWLGDAARPRGLNCERGWAPD